jgi:hypothetical protein
VVGQVAVLDVSHAAHPYNISVRRVTNAVATRSILRIRRGGCAGFGAGVAMVGRYDQM